MRAVLVLVAIYAVLIAAGVMLDRRQRGASVATATRARFAPASAVTATPEQPATPTAPVTMAPDVAPAPAVSSVPAAPVFEPNTVEPQSPSVPEGWAELPSQQETPTIEITNEDVDGDPTRVVFVSDRGIFELDCSGAFASIKIPADDYRYQLRGWRYNRTGEPDQVGGFRCRKYRMYRLYIVKGNEDPGGSVDVGD